MAFADVPLGVFTLLMAASIRGKRPFSTFPGVRCHGVRQLRARPNATGPTNPINKETSGQMTSLGTPRG